MWSLKVDNEFENDLINTIYMNIEVFEYESNLISESREGQVSDLFYQIITDFILNALRPKSKLIPIRLRDCPYLFSSSNKHKEERENAYYILQLLSSPPFNYLKINKLIPPSPSDETEHKYMLLVVQVDDGLTELITLMSNVRPSVETNVISSSSDNNELDYSRLLDVHKCSDHHEVDDFVDKIYNEHFAGLNEAIRKKHVKVLLLSLYVNWLADPKLYTAFERNVNAYKPKSRYNAVHISKTMIKVVDKLLIAGLINQKDGFFDRGRGIGRTSRLSPTETLISFFEDASFTELDVFEHADRECIILRDKIENKAKNKKSKAYDKEYEDTNETISMREQLHEYNNLIANTFIDIPTLENSWVDSSSDDLNKTARIYISHANKFTRRVFNRGSFKHGGRYYGGWWQSCPSDYRSSIFMNDEAVSEVDYSGLHIIILYALEGIDYWNEYNEGPYENLERPDFIEEEDDYRAIVKSLMLVAINAASDTAAFGAFRQNEETGSPYKKLKNSQLLEILDPLRTKHKPIQHMFASDSGINLMNIDSNITSLIMQHFVDQGIPILMVHDSYLVPSQYEDDLKDVMIKSFTDVLGKTVKLKSVTHHPEEFELLSEADAVSSTVWEKAMKYRYDPPRSKRYQTAYEQFRIWRDSNGKHEPS